MDFGGSTMTRLIGGYILGPRIGSGSLAVVWGSTHRHSGLEVAVKEIDKKQLSPKVSENLVKEISILSTINHPNIIRLFEAIQVVLRVQADLWSVGAILYQLVTGRPPFDGNSQLQLFQNILASTEVQFTPEALKELHPDCLDLCRSLLHRNPEERLTFNAFFNHNFLLEPRSIVNVEKFQLHQSERSMVHQLVISASEKMLQSHSEYHVESFVDDPVIVSSAVNETMPLQRNDAKITAGTKSVKGLTPTIASEKLGKSVDAGAHLSNQPQVSHLMESIEKDYVIVNPHFTSLETFSDYFEASAEDNSSSRDSICPSKSTNLEIGFAKQTKDPSSCYADGLENSKSNELEALVASCEFAALRKEQGISLLCLSNRLELLRHYVWILAELSQEKYNAGPYLESFAVELVVLATWKKALEICSYWLASITAGTADMPDAMEIIFQQALSVGTSGAVDEYMENRDRAAASYSKATLLLSFNVGEAVDLPLNPPFSLLAANKKRILKYILNLQSHKKSSSESSSTEAHFLLST